MTEAVTNGPRDQRSQVFVVTNYSEDLALSGTESSAAAIAAVLATLISELKAKGVIRFRWIKHRGSNSWGRYYNF